MESIIKTTNNTVYLAIKYGDTAKYDAAVNLTKMFGAGNEPTSADDPLISTVEQYALVHQDNNPGELLNFSNSAVVSSSGHRLDTSAIVQKYFPTGMKSAGAVHDEIDWERMVAIQRVGSVDLGTMNWRLASDYQPSSLFSTHDMPNDHNNSAMLTPFYTKTSAQFSGMEDKTIRSSIYSLADLFIKDSAYTEATEFKSAMSGVMLHYELAKSIETPITEAFDPSVEVKAGGTLTFENDQGADFHVPVPNQETFMIKLPGGTT